MTELDKKRAVWAENLLSDLFFVELIAKRKAEIFADWLKTGPGATDARESLFRQASAYETLVGDVQRLADSVKIDAFNSRKQKN